MSDSILSLESAKIRNYIIPIFLDKKAREFRVEYFFSIDIGREKYNLFTCLHDKELSTTRHIYIFQFWTQ